MIRLNQGAKPQVLVENSEAWTAEYVNWWQNRVGTEPHHYAREDIRKALEAETSSKCAYCEGQISDVAYTNIEHKLPKSRHPHSVCAWENLTIACPRCNTNKGDYDAPECPLLDPYTDDVEEAVAFGGPLALPRGGDRSRATITRLRLNRMDLPGIGHQAAVVEGDLDTVGVVAWQHLFDAPFPGPFFCYKTIIPEAQEHLLAASGR